MSKRYPQHPSNPEKLLIDKFHEENTYFICLDGTRLVGMVAVRGKRPFSLDEKVADLDAHLPTAASVCEIRLLAIEPEYRHTNIFARLFHFAAGQCIKEGYTLAVASGTLRQQRLYFPKGTDFRKVTDKKLASVVRKINNRPRKCLNYWTPHEVIPKVERDFLITRIDILCHHE